MTNGRRACLNGRPCEPRSLEESLYCAVHHSASDATSIASEVGVRVGYLHDASNPDRDGMQFQARLLVPLMRAARNLSPLRLMARQMGAVLVMLPDADVVGDVRQKFMAATKELGDVAAEIDRALASDDQIDAGEFDRIDRELSEAVEAFSQLRHVIAKKAGKA